MKYLVVKNNLLKRTGSNLVAETNNLGDAKRVLKMELEKAKVKGKLPKGEGMRNGNKELILGSMAWKIYKPA